MINTFAQIDYLACAGQSVWHRASAIGKLLLALVIVLAVVLAPAWPPIAVLFGTALALAIWARLPIALVAAAASTPLLVTAIFVLAHWSGDAVHAVTLALRGMSASVTAVWLVGTTPYPDLFAPLSRLLPRNVGDSLFLTYRAVFALLARVERLWRALFLRGAISGPFRQRFGRMGEAVGTVVLSGFDRSQRLYQTMLLRGHSGRICGCRHYLEFTRDDTWVALVFAWVVAALILFWRGA